VSFIHSWKLNGTFFISLKLSQFEMVFSKLKNILRSKINNNYKQIIQNIKVSFNKITKTELNNYYNKSLNIK